MDEILHLWVRRHISEGVPAGEMLDHESAAALLAGVTQWRREYAGEGDGHGNRKEGVMAREYSSLWKAIQAARVAAAPAYAEAVDAADEEYQAAIRHPDCDYAAAWSRCYMARKDAAVAYDNAIRQAILTYRSRETHECTISDGLATGGLKPPSPTGIGRLRAVSFLDHRRSASTAA